ncbi:MAG: serine protease [Dehalococcoidia bacterium]
MRIVVLLDGLVMGAGSGSIVGDGRLVLTNAHVVHEGDQFEVILADETGVSLVSPAELVALDSVRDLALLRLPRPIGEPLLFADVRPRLGESITIAGYPDLGGNSLTVTMGTVSGYADLDDGLGPAWMKTDALTSFGSSGGAALDGSGRLVGIPTLARGNEIATLGYLLDAGEARPFVAENEMRTSVQRESLPVNPVATSGADADPPAVPSTPSEGGGRAPATTPPTPSAQDVASLTAAILLTDLWDGFQTLLDDFALWQSLGSSAGILYSHGEIAGGFASVSVGVATYVREVRSAAIPPLARPACNEAHLALQRTISSLGLMASAYADIYRYWPTYDGFGLVSQYSDEMDADASRYFALSDQCLQ